MAERSQPSPEVTQKQYLPGFRQTQDPVSYKNATNATKTRLKMFPLAAGGFDAVMKLADRLLLARDLLWKGKDLQKIGQAVIAQDFH